MSKIKILVEFVGTITESKDDYKITFPPAISRLLKNGEKIKIGVIER
jgi:hypothetical protein